MWKMENSLDISKYTNKNKERQKKTIEQKRAKKIVAIWWKTMLLFATKNKIKKKQFFRFTEVMNI